MTPRACPATPCTENRRREQPVKDALHPPFPYFGGKWRAAGRIWEALGDHPFPLDAGTARPRTAVEQR